MQEYEYGQLSLPRRTGGMMFLHTRDERPETETADRPSVRAGDRRGSGPHQVCSPILRRDERA